jgi:hypothetical protein
VQDGIGRLPIGKAVAHAEIATGDEDGLRILGVQAGGAPFGSASSAVAAIDDNDVRLCQFMGQIALVEVHTSLTRIVGIMVDNFAHILRRRPIRRTSRYVENVCAQFGEEARGGGKRPVQKLDDPDPGERESAFSHFRSPWQRQSKLRFIYDRSIM